MAELSLLAAMMKKAKGQPHNTGISGPRSSARMPAKRSFARGSLGSYGSRTFKSRNPDAGKQKEVEMLRSPIFAAFMRETFPTTPITDFLRRNG